MKTRTTFLHGLVPCVAVTLCLPSLIWAQTAPAAEAIDAVGTAQPEAANWPELSLQQKRAIGEKIGEEGAAAYARGAGYKELLPHHQKTYRHGFDQVWYDPRTKEIVAFEAKGGAGKLRGAQGTAEDVVEGAKRIMNSPTASPREKKVAQFVLEHAAEGKLRVETVHTPHANGVPGKPQCIKVDRPSPAVQEAAEAALKEAERAGTLPLGKRRRPSETEKALESMRSELDVTDHVEPTEASRTAKRAKRSGSAPENAKQATRAGHKLGAKSRGVRNSGATDGAEAFADELRAVEESVEEFAEDAGKVTRLAKKIAKHAEPAAKWVGRGIVAAEIGTAVVQHYEIERRYRAGEISAHDRWVKHAEAAGGAAGAWAGAEAGFVAGGLVGSAFGPVGSAVGAVGGAIVGGVAGSKAGEWIGRKAVSLAESLF